VFLLARQVLISIEMKYSWYILGFVFVAMVSFFSAMTINSLILQMLLFLSAIISLALGIL
jgi:hypothetical protein